MFHKVQPCLTHSNSTSINTGDSGSNHTAKAILVNTAKRKGSHIWLVKLHPTLNNQRLWDPLPTPRRLIARSPPTLQWLQWPAIQLPLPRRTTPKTAPRLLLQSPRLTQRCPTVLVAAFVRPWSWITTTVIDADMGIVAMLDSNGGVPDN
jgi:hypothetical protein